MAKTTIEQSPLIKVRILELRKRAKLSRPAMAELLDVSPATLKNYEMGYRYPSVPFIVNLGHKLDKDAMLYVLGFGPFPTTI